MGEKDMVNHPEYYISDKGIEVIDVIEAFTEGLEGIEATDTGNIIKYICRWKHKNGLQDLEKARWYLNHLIERVDSKEKIGWSNLINELPPCIYYDESMCFLPKGIGGECIGFEQCRDYTIKNSEKESN